MEYFSTRYDDLEGKIKQLGGYKENLEKNLRLKESSVLTKEREQVLDHNIEKLDTQFSDMCIIIKEILDDLEKKLDDEMGNTMDGDRRDNTYVSFITLMLHKQGGKFTEIVRSYQMLQSMNKQEESKKLMEALHIVNPNFKDKDMDILLRDIECKGEKYLDIFRIGDSKNKDLLIQAERRRNKIEKIAKLISDLLKTIEEVERVVQRNGRGLGKIVLNMEAADANAEEATSQLAGALGYVRSVMRLKRILALIILLLVIALLVWLFKRPGGSHYYYNNKDS